MESYICIMIDHSGSMSAKVDSTDRLHWALNAAVRIIGSLHNHSHVAISQFDTIFGNLAFTTVEKSIKTCEELQEVIAKPTGGTHLFDCAGKAAEMLASHGRPEDEHRLIVITDDEDAGSSRFHSWGDLDSFLGKLPARVRLQIVPVSESSLAEGLTRQDVTKTGLTGPTHMGQNIDICFDPTTLFAGQYSLSKPLFQISAPFINLDESVTGEDLAFMAEAYREIIPHIEKVTELRYYPVPTVIIPESILKQKMEAPVIDDKMLCELISILCIFYYHKEIPQLDSKGNNRNDLDKKTEEEKWVRWRAEWFGDFLIEYFTTSHVNSFENENRGKDIFPRHGNNFQKILKTLLDWLNRSWHKAPHDMTIKSYKPFSQWNIFPDIICYLGISKSINLGDWKWIEKGDGPGSSEESFSTSAGQAAILFSALVKWAKERMDQTAALGAFLNKGCPKDDLPQTWFERNVRRLGFYQSRGTCMDYLPQDVININRNSGLVFICARPVLYGNGLEETVSVSDYNSDHTQRIDPILARGIFASILVHEHTHAILEEGVEPRRAKPSTEASALEEAIAEWIEIQWCRKDPALLIWVLGHAMSGLFPGWPYAGALHLESMAASGKVNVRDLIHSFRDDPENAYSSFLEKIVNMNMARKRLLK